jgi:hypothetical protein
MRRLPEPLQKMPMKSPITPQQPLRKISEAVITSHDMYCPPIATVHSETATARVSAGARVCRRLLHDEDLDPSQPAPCIDKPKHEHKESATKKSRKIPGYLPLSINIRSYDIPLQR